MEPFEVASNSGMKYVATFIVKKTRFIVAYPVRNKSETAEKFHEFYKMITAKTGIVIKRLRSHNGGEYKNKIMKNICDKLKIAQEFTVPYNPEQNGLAERYNRTLIEMVRCMLKDSGMEKKYLAEAIKTAVYVRNMVENDVSQGKSPFEATFKQKPDLDFMRVFGCISFAHVPKQKRSKLDDTAVKCRMLGYAEDQKAYHVMELKTAMVFSSRSVVFKETYGEPVKHVSFDLTATHKEPVHQENIGGPVGPVSDDFVMEDASEVPFSAPSRSKVTSVSDTPRSQFDDIKDRHTNKRMAMPDLHLDDGTEVYCLVADTLDEQASSYEQIMKSECRDQWKKAMDAEMKSIKSQGTWELRLVNNFEHRLVDFSKRTSGETVVETAVPSV